jgi:hypothetical protein
VSFVRDHLVKAHQSNAEHQRALAKCCRKAAGNLKTMSKAKKADMSNDEDDDEMDFSSVTCDLLNQLADEHDSQATAEDGMLSECMKAQREDDLAKGDPALRGISAINWGVNRLVPRAGAPEVGKSALPEVPEELKKVIGTDEQIYGDV